LADIPYRHPDRTDWLHKRLETGTFAIAREPEPGRRHVDV
jgi:hypothetical protein